jgi:hypothetical protein
MPEAADLSTPLAWALAYAQIGWHVLPLEPGQKQPLGRLVPRGMLDATTDITTIRSWWARHPKAGIGIALAQSGLVAVDVDPRNGGNETFEALQSDHGSLRSEVMAFTGGGGEHHVFVVPPGVQISLPGTLGPGIDLKANGYIVVEPSIHPSGKTYQWEASSSPLDGVAPSPLPDWLRSLRVALKQTEPMAGSVPVDPRQAKDAREALYCLDADDYHEWVQAGMALHATGWGHPAYAMWCAWSQQSQKFDATVCRQKWESFRAPSDRGAKGVTLAWIFGRAQATGWRNPAASVPAAVPAQDESAETHERPSNALPLIFAEDITAEGIELTQLVEDTITAGGLSVMYGESNSGKSFLACDMACSIGSGGPWMGKRTVQGAVLYVAGEGAQSIKLRILAWRQHHGVMPWVAVVPVSVNLLDPGADLARVVEAAQAVHQRYGHPVSLIQIDTLARAFGGGNENASEDMGAVIKHADLLREKTGAHVMFVHHAGKDASKGSRGHSSLKAATDTEIEVIGDADSKLHTAEITKQRDLGSRGEKLVARFEVVKMGLDQWGKDVTTCVVQPTNEAPPEKKTPTQAKRADLCSAMSATLMAAQNQTMRKGVLVQTLLDAGFGRSSIFRAYGDLQSGGMLTEVSGMVHLNNRGLA